MKVFRKNTWLLLFFLIGCQETRSKLNVEEIDQNQDVYQVAFLIMNGVYNTELTAPFDIFHHTIFRDNIKPMNVFTISETTALVSTFEGLQIKPDYSYLEGNFPPIDILIVPSAEHHLDSDLENSTMIRFVQKTAENAKYICSHCDGAFVLAKAGLLEDKVCTTFPSDINSMRNMFPDLDIRDSLLFVHDQNIISSVGGAKSFEASLYLTQLLYGKKIADELAEGLVIDWDLGNIKHLIISE